MNLRNLGPILWVTVVFGMLFAMAATRAFAEESLTLREAAKATILAPTAPPGSAHLCDVYSMGAGPISVSVPTYPCEVMRTYSTLETLEQKRGFLATSARIFLKTRLFTRGIFSSIFGLFGIG